MRTEEPSERPHWAEGTPAWERMTEASKRAAREIDFSATEIPICYASLYPFLAAGRSVLDPLNNRKLESVEAAKSCPRMFGKSGRELRRIRTAPGRGKLLGGKKCESGKYRKARIYYVATFERKCGFRFFDTNVRTVTTTAEQLTPSGNEKERQLSHFMNWLTIQTNGMATSSDRVSWSASPKAGAGD